jgi:hypothetical protein
MDDPKLEEEDGTDVDEAEVEEEFPLEALE